MINFKVTFTKLYKMKNSHFICQTYLSLLRSFPAATEPQIAVNQFPKSQSPQIIL
jgi:hypothetical protein